MKKLIFFFVCATALSFPCPDSRAAFPDAKHDLFQAHQDLVAASESVQDGRDPEAEKILAGVPASRVFGFWKSVLSAQVLYRKGQAQAVLDLLKPYLDDAALEPTDAKNKNQDFYRRLYRDALKTAVAASESTGSPSAIWTRRLWALFPDLDRIPSPAPEGVTSAEKATRLHLLFDESLFDAIPALMTVSDISGADLAPKEKCRALFEWATALRKLNRKDEALPGFAAVDDLACPGKIRTRALYWKGVTESELNRDAAAEGTFEKLAKHPEDRQYADDVYYRLYTMYQKDGQDERAAEALKNLLSLSEGDMKEKYLWDQAFTAYRSKDYSKTLDLLDGIIAMRALGTEAQAQALYWKGRTLEVRSGKKLGGGAAAVYAELLKTYPFSFYAAFAEARTGKQAAMPAFVKFSGFPADAETAAALRVVDQLNHKDDHASAADVMDYLSYVAASGDLKPEFTAHRWSESDDPHRALEMATESLDVSVFDIRLKKENPLSRSLYPLGYPEEVKKAASSSRLPMGLIWGIMREESLFARTVRSRAGALGLMQLMPGTAKLKSKGLGIPFSLGDLSVPASNIRLGSSYLRDTMSRFGDQMALAVMAYNAGPGNVSKWMNTQGDLPMDEFIESVPFSETRGYVKRVLRSARIYGHLLGQSKTVKPFKSLQPPR